MLTRSPSVSAAEDFGSLDARVAQESLLKVMWLPGWEGSLGENQDTSICMVGALCCVLESITTLLIGYIPIKIKSLN